MTTLRQAAVAALEALEITSSEYCQGCWLEVIAALKEALSQLDRKCEAGPSLQDLWDCWDAVHGGQKPTAWMSPTGDTIVHTKNVGYTPNWTDYYTIPLYLHPAPIPEGWQLVPKEPTKEMSDVFWSAYIPAPDGMAQSCSFEDFHDFRYMYKAMLAAAPKYEEQSK